MTDNGADAEIHEQFRAALEARGIVAPEPLVDDGAIHRCDAEGHEGGNDATYVLHCDNWPAGGYANWTDGQGWQNWRADLDHPLSAAELAELRQKAQDAQVQREADETARHAKAARRAADNWASATPCTSHAYLTRKGVQPHGLRISARGNLIVPMRDIAGLLHSLQVISPNGEKRYLKDGRAAGCLYMIGGEPADTVLIAEGFATGASVHEVIEHPVAVAFSCTNLLAVASALRAKYPAARIVILADDDYQTAGNPGSTKAKEAAAAIDASVAVPDFGPNRPDGAKDFNDLMLHAGAEAVRACIEQALADGPQAALWPAPDMSVLQLNRREPPALPLEVFGADWAGWIADGAEATASPVDYVVMPLLDVASTLIGNARWPKATPLWSEPPHLWIAEVGDSGSSKSPGSDPLFRYILPDLERRMTADFPDKLRLWRAAAEIVKSVEETWKAEVRAARKAGRPPPDIPDHIKIGPEPQAPRLRQNDVTIEKMALVLATAAPKGVLIVRDELAGWLLSLSHYNEGGRAFWIEAYGGRTYIVERVKHPEPIAVPHLAVSVFGGIQPDRIAELMAEGDDGLLARFAWSWPNPMPFRLTQETPGIEWAIEALDRLRLLDLQPGDPPKPIMVPLAVEAVLLLEKLGQDMQKRQEHTGGLMRSALGKARGLVLRLSLVLEMLWWCAAAGAEAPPTEISVKALAAAAVLVDRYFLPMAERVYGDAALPDDDRHAATIARWIMQTRPNTINARDIRRSARLPGLREAEKVKRALTVLVEADWLMPAFSRIGGSSGRLREDYAVNPRLFEETTP